MNIVIFGLCITSSWGNGHATTYRALAQALRQRGHRITFFERDAEWYASNRDLPRPGFCEVRIYDDWQKVLPEVRRKLAEADVAMAGSFFPDGVAAIREMLDSPAAVKAFYDIDTPITLNALRSQGRTSYLEAEQLPGLDLYFSFTGGPALEELESLGVPRAVPLYCSVDPAAHRPLPPSPKFACDLSYMGTYAPDRQPKLEELLCSPARALPQHKFFVAGPQYPGSIAWPKNVTREIHLEPKFHALLYSSSRLVLNVTRRDMVMAGYSPSVRLFEAAACGAAIVSDSWPGLDEFFVPGKEILLASGGADVESWITGLSSRELAGIGEAARARVLAEHTSEVRARQWEAEVEAARAPAATSAATM